MVALLTISYMENGSRNQVCTPADTGSEDFSKRGYFFSKIYQGVNVSAVWYDIISMNELC